jgi:hypothetical protein
MNEQALPLNYLFRIGSNHDVCCDDCLGQLNCTSQEKAAEQEGELLAGFMGMR